MTPSKPALINCPFCKQTRQRGDRHTCPPANSPRSWTKDDDWFVCACGSFVFNVMKRDGRCHVLCAKCEADHTVNVWEPKP